MSWLLHFQSSFLLMAWGSSREWLRILELYTHAGDLEEAPSSWVQVSSVLLFTAIWGVDHQMEDLLSTSFPLSLKFA